MEIIKEKINKEYLKKFLDNPFKEMIKFVVDIEREIIALGGELHSDAAELLIKDGSDNKNLWGANLYSLKQKKEEQIEYSSLINIRPSQDNYSMNVENQEIRNKINQIIKKLIYGE
ncbi:hypothetical protein KAS79_03805 [Candidatus Parcubacteria bacterium]|nr:hypothetical protein [Candidatus Parcubacteria bacterium]